MLMLSNGLSDLYVGMENKMYLCTQILSQFTIQILETYLLKNMYYCIVFETLYVFLIWTLYHLVFVVFVFKYDFSFPLNDTY